MYYINGIKIEKINSREHNTSKVAKNAIVRKIMLKSRPYESNTINSDSIIIYELRDIISVRGVNNTLQIRTVIVII